MGLSYKVFSDLLNEIELIDDKIHINDHYCSYGGETKKYVKFSTNYNCEDGRSLLLEYNHREKDSSENNKVYWDLVKHFKRRIKFYIGSDDYVECGIAI